MKLSLKPHHIRGEPNVWWYEETKGITVVHEIHVQGRYNRTDTFLIPWRSLKGYVKRRDMTDGER